MVDLFLKPAWLATTVNLKICRQVPIGVFRHLHLRADPSTYRVHQLGLYCHLRSGVYNRTKYVHKTVFGD